LFTWVRPRAGSVAFPSLRADINIESFAGDLVRQVGVLILPGTVYDYPGNHFRIGFGRPTMPEALARLEEYATAHWQ
jgi:aspartate/methionine/tyrosine aminotransferase